MTDPIADMLTRIRNASRNRHERVDVPSSRLKLEIARILKEEGYIKNFKHIADKKRDIIRIFLRYDENRRPVIEGIQRVSRPGRRLYSKNDEILSVLGGLGIAIVSTSAGIMTDKLARNMKVGGEVLCAVW